ncbi:MAG TPA: hypothetical protein VIM42_11415 [Clostridium sp.]
MELIDKTVTTTEYDIRLTEKEVLIIKIALGSYKFEDKIEDVETGDIIDLYDFFNYEVK